MTKTVILILMTAVSFGCSKSNDPVKPVTTPLPITATHYYAANHLISYRNFYFDSSQHLASIYLRQNDTLDPSSGFFEVDSGTYLFNLDPVTHLPNGYRFDYKKGYFGAQAYIETHLMYYNSQNQLIKDSGLLLLPGQNQNPVTKYYTYSGATTICISYLGSDPFILDTIITSNENIIYLSTNYSDGYGGWTNQLRYTADYSTTTNPMYNGDLANSLGAFLLVEGIDDFISKNLTSNNGISWVTGANGRVISGSAPNGDYTLFTY